MSRKVVYYQRFVQKGIGVKYMDCLYWSPLPLLLYLLILLFFLLTFPNLQLQNLELLHTLIYFYQKILFLKILIFPIWFELALLINKFFGKGNMSSQSSVSSSDVLAPETYEAVGIDPNDITSVSVTNGYGTIEFYSKKGNNDNSFPLE